MEEQLSLLHPHKKVTQADRVYNHLKEHGRITNMQCHELYGIRHCPSVIRDIRKMLEFTPWEIVNNRKKGCNRFGDQVWWDEYVLQKRFRDVPVKTGTDSY